MIVSAQYRDSAHAWVTVNPIAAENQPVLGEFAVGFGSATIYISRTQLLMLLSECEKALHSTQEAHSE